MDTAVRRNGRGAHDKYQETRVDPGPPPVDPHDKSAATCRASARAPAAEHRVLPAKPSDRSSTHRWRRRVWRRPFRSYRVFAWQRRMENRVFVVDNIIIIILQDRSNVPLYCTHGFRWVELWVPRYHQIPMPPLVKLIYNIKYYVNYYVIMFSKNTLENYPINRDAIKVQVMIWPFTEMIWTFFGNYLLSVNF